MAVDSAIRDPLWNNIQIDAQALDVLDTEPLQRLRYVRQLGHAFLVYPGATHTRFEHALGTYHLARRVLTMLRERGELEQIDPHDVAIVPLAALLHDIGHYPFSHALEEAGLPHHEDLARLHLEQPDLGDALDGCGIPDWADRLLALIRGTSSNPLTGLIAGSLDLDKIEYLTRDARMCGVPYGAVDVDRLLNALTLVPGGDGPTIGIREKGISALESLLFARYQMYRNVYWHHAVRAATAMFKRLVRTAIAAGQLSAEWVSSSTDDALMERLRQSPAAPLADRLYFRQLYKRAVEIPGHEVPDGAGDWVASEPALVAAVEDRLAAEHGVPAGTVLLDYPAKSRMLDVDLLLLTRDGAAEPLTRSGGRIQLQRIADELHTSARCVRVFTATPVTVNPNAILSLLDRAPDEVRDLIARDAALA